MELPQLVELGGALGVLGLFLLSMVDSAGIPTGGAPDVAILVMAPMAAGSWQVVGLVVTAVIGSTAGCVILYLVGQRSGARLLARFDVGARERAHQQINRHGIWAVAVAVLGPPPYPTKLFILLAGVLQMRLAGMIAGVVAGRVLRYGMAGYLGARYGQRAAAIISEDYVAFVGTLAILVVGFIAVRVLWRRRASS
ncbi:YqaA family protein [Candidatus Latescibacterota bacterium]